MEQRKKPDLRLVEPEDREPLGKRLQMNMKYMLKHWGSRTVLAAVIIAVAYLILTNKQYTEVVRTIAYKEEASDANRYEQFGTGIVRYSRDGVVFLNRRNEEQWIHPCQIRHPVIDTNGETFAVADVGGNSILVFTEEGIKGEMETTLPIEKISISDQGIVSAILKNETTPMIMLYDATGNVLVEQQVSSSSMGYPVAIDLSADGKTLGVSYLLVKDGAQKSGIVFYNYGKPGSEKADNVVSKDYFDDQIIPEIFFMGDNTAVAVGDKSIILYTVGSVPDKKDEVALDQEIKSVFHTDQYIGLVLLNSDKSGFEARLYNKNGKQIMNTEFEGEYSDIKMVKDEIIMTGDSNCQIITKKGLHRFKGDMKGEVLEIIPAAGPNRYLVMSDNTLSNIFLIR